MNLKFRLTIAFFLCLILTLGFVAVATLVNIHHISLFDTSIIAWVQGLQTPWLTRVMKFFTFIGSGNVESILAIIIAVFLFKHRRSFILFVAVIAGSELLNVALKHLFHRMRPDTHRLIEISGYSFPSGHSMGAFSLYGILAFLIWKHIPSKIGRILVILFSTTMILMIGISRIYLGVHYPSDILGGFLASAAWLTGSIWVYQAGSRKKHAT